MENITRIYVMATYPITDHELALIAKNVEENNGPNVRGKLIPDCSDDNQTFYVDLVESDNPDKCEASQFILAVEETGDDLQCFWGKPEVVNGEYVNIA